MIVVISQNQNFAESLAGHAVSELAVDCECVRIPAQAEVLKADLVISDQPLGLSKTTNALVVTPPLRLSETLRMIRRALKAADEPRRLNHGITFALRGKQLISDENGQTINLTDKECQLLEALNDANGEMVSKDALLRSIWGIEAELNTHTLETHIYRLRMKLKECSDADMIEATQGGYRLLQ